MSKITDNEDTHSPDKSEMTNYESHDHGERHHGERYHGERHHGGQEVGVVRYFSIETTRSPVADGFKGGSKGFDE